MFSEYVDPFGRNILLTILDSRQERCGNAEQLSNIRDEFDFIFGAPVSGVFFGALSPLAVVDADGTLLFERVLDSVTPLIEAAQRQAAEASAARVQKHTARYQNSPTGLAPGQTVPLEDIRQAAQEVMQAASSAAPAP